MILTVVWIVAHHSGIGKSKRRLTAAQGAEADEDEAAKAVPTARLWPM